MKETRLSSLYKKQLAGGGVKTATDTIIVRVKGSIYDNSKSQIIGPKF
ncbi:hypothetical protein ACETAC_01505 [Aceticella autotrophica]|uniref:Uncharacterized protein n=1 Tax=Aceticella autotrophica TaxID=2755338 RepID=A0A975AW97_9THEO|nr:hypothetical protein [Aceticella autotrophica]QSZ27614.1 hypothetical protein ACETAC_01505 [Aceticella autotrophica]